VNIPTIPQNSTIQISQQITLPQQPLGFPGDGGKVYLVFKANSTGTVLESDYTNNVSPPTTLFIEAPLPELAVVGFDVPPTMQPGDVIQPNIRIANFGPADTAAQGPLGIALVASTTKTFVPGFSTVIATYFVANVPGAQNIATEKPLFADANQSPQENVVTIAGNPVQLPNGPAKYYIGVVIDPFGLIKQLSSVASFKKPTNNFSLPQQVGPPIVGLPPAWQVVGGGANNVPVFPNPFGGLKVGGSLDGTSFPVLFPPTGPTTTAASSVSTSGTPSAVTPGSTNVGLFQSGRSNITLYHSTPPTGPATTFLGNGAAFGVQVAQAAKMGGTISSPASIQAI
jgi:hypothetical protein